MDIARTITLSQPYAEVVPRVREALAGQGFGVLTEIDMTATMKQKRGADIEDFVILGACNPELAERALNIDRRVGVLLPCNVAVRAISDGRGTMVQLMNPQLLAVVTDNPDLAPIADEADRRMSAVLATLQQ
ncbi:DUF302 domain-containing protein [Pseudonocardia sp. RS11V-5]|uniref:DUF302 domain-containing protein n=1 Tax=Pseudonocardia terrae TaxID=2905831 RepID=UPI001E36FC51|nr:DUF302 domain-containing protein [Pseudonocardia terrae]MCE3553167.1 DUF302 domain-containing protein [Pseudonocardia terrae]